jgi:hypothetical protein
MGAANACLGAPPNRDTASPKGRQTCERCAVDNSTHALKKAGFRAQYNFHVKFKMSNQRLRAHPRLASLGWKVLSPIETTTNREKDATKNQHTDNTRQVAVDLANG